MPADRTFSLPTLLTPNETCSFVHISRSELGRWMKAHQIEFIKLSEGRSGRIRIVRDSLLEHLGLLDYTPSRRRRNQQAERELHRAAVRFGIDIEDKTLRVAAE